MASSNNTKSSNINSEGITNNIKNDIKEGMNSTSNNNDINEDQVIVFVAYNGKWEWDGKEWLFKNFKGSITVVSKHITLSQITDILKRKLNVLENFFLKLEVHYKVGSLAFPVIEIKDDHDLSVFMAETSKTRIPLCVTRVLKDGAVKGVHFNVEEHDNPEEEYRHDREDHVIVFAAYNGKWEYDGKEWFFKDSKSSIMVVPKHITLSEINDLLNEKFKVNKKLYRLKLEVHYRTGSPWFPVTQIQDTKDLSVFISETSKTKLPLCVTLLKHYEFQKVDEERRKVFFPEAGHYNKSPSNLRNLYYRQPN